MKRKRKRKPTPITSYLNFWIAFQLIGGIIATITMYYIAHFILHIL
jgi:hypothetical protein